MAEKLAKLSGEAKEKRLRESQDRYNEKKPAITFRIEREAKEELESIAEKEGLPLGTMIYNTARDILNQERKIVEGGKKVEEAREKSLSQLESMKKRFSALFKYTAILLILSPVMIYAIILTDSYNIIPVFSMAVSVVIILLFYFTLQNV